MALTLLMPIGGAQAAPEVPNPRVNDGDLLITNHSFEDGTTGWTTSNGRGETGPPRCASVPTTTADGASDGEQALSLPGTPPCLMLGVVSTPVAAVAGESYTAFAHTGGTGHATIGLRFLDDAGTVLASSQGERTAAGDVVEFTAEAPAGATRVAVELGGQRQVTFDQVLITGEYTMLKPQVTKRGSFLGMAAGVDENGRHVTFAVATGSAFNPAVLVVTDILTGEVTNTVEVPGATGSWTIEQDPESGMVYIGTYQSPALYGWQPGDPVAERIGTPPIEHFGFTYGLNMGKDGTLYGGAWGEPTAGYAGAQLWQYHPDTGFAKFGPTPLTPEANYTRAVGYEDATETVWAGTGTGVAKLYGCDTGGTPGSEQCKDFTSLLGPVADATWVYGITAGSGYVQVWGGDSSSTGNDYLIVLKVTRDANGELQAESIKEIKGVIYNGSSPVVDDKIYYTMANTQAQGIPLHSFDVVTGEIEVITEAPTQIFSRQWEIVDLEDPEWPGPSVVGWNSGANLVKYNIETGNFEHTLVEDIPMLPTGLNSITGGPDGNVWSAGYLTGGLGKHPAMRDDQQVAKSIGGQAEVMTNYRGRVRQGNYPYGDVRSFSPADFEAGTQPRVDCVIGAEQNRPYALVGHGDRLYYGSQAEYGHDMGAFGWMDLTTGECHTLEGVIGHQSVNAIAASGSKVFGGGNIFFSYDGVPIDSQAKLIIHDESDDSTRTIEWPVPNTRSINAAVTAPDGTVWFYAEGWLVAMDPETEEVIHTEEVFADWKPGDRIAGNYARMLVLDGRIYGIAGGRVFTVDPARTLAEGSATSSLQILFQGADKDITTDGYGNLYVIDQQTRLLRINPRGVVAA
ncbi:hypothetical protein ACQBAU_11660 [Propionibacteriaceae bacterium Y2011]